MLRLYKYIMIQCAENSTNGWNCTILCIKQRNLFSENILSTLREAGKGEKISVVIRI